MRTERSWSTRTLHLFSALGIAACSIYDPTLLSSVRSTSSGGELGIETGGLPGKSEGGASSLGGASSGGSNRGGSTGGPQGGATGGNTTVGSTTSNPGGDSAGGDSAGSDSGGAPATGGSPPQGGSKSTGGAGGTTSGGVTATGGTATGGTATGGSATGGVVSTQGGSSGSGGSSGGSGGKSSGGAAGGSSCAGSVFQGLCWYLGPRGESCDAACTTHGGVAAGAQAFVGTATQGGSLSECRQLLTLLGVTTAPFLGERDDVGLGCHLYDADPYWLDAPDFTTDASVPESRIVCACRR